MSTYTLTITDNTGQTLHTQEHFNERGIKVGATRRLNGMNRDGIQAKAEIVDEDGYVIYSKTTDNYTEAVVAPEPETDDEPTPQAGTRKWKVIRKGGPNRSFKTREAAQDYARTLDEDVQVVYGDLRAPKECGCGCGEMTKGGRFLPGHDRRFYVLAEKAKMGDPESMKVIARVGIPQGAEKVEGEFDPEIECDAACEFAQSDKCTCSCGGHNHGKGGRVLAEMMETA